MFCCLSQSIYRILFFTLSCALYSSLLFYRLKMFSCFYGFWFRLIARPWIKCPIHDNTKTSYVCFIFSRHQKNPRDLLSNWLSQIYIQSTILPHHLFIKNYSTWRRLSGWNNLVLVSKLDCFFSRFFALQTFRNFLWKFFLILYRILFFVNGEV